MSIKDTGIGIAPEIMQRLFTKFATKPEKGTGLGLFISKSIVEAHGGKIWVILIVKVPHFTLAYL
jgi:two-component system, OmpR family, sensor histidine kinase VicK